MHVATLLFDEMFQVRRAGAVVSSDSVFPDWGYHDRFGILIDTALGGIGAAHLIQLATVKFYDAKSGRRKDKIIYPEIYAFHIGQAHGSHADFDFWPARRELVVKDEPHHILEAINDRGITRLAIPERKIRPADHKPKEMESALDRMSTAFFYAPSGRVDDADLTIQGLHTKTEYNIDRVLKAGLRSPSNEGGGMKRGNAKEIDPAFFEHLFAWSAHVHPEERKLAAENRLTLGDKGFARESYRTASIEDVLARL